MTTARSTMASDRLGLAPGWSGPVAITLGLAAIVGVRATAVRLGLDALVVGALFGVALCVLAYLGRLPPPDAAGAFRARRAVLAAAVGALVGLLLVGVAVVGPAIAGAPAVPGIGRPAAPFAPWALITLVVAAGEEGVLRGALFDRVERLAGLRFAVALTTSLFALMHVPLYGWHVVPLDLAVGLVLAGLRISTRGLVAPIAAHAVADLATWWL